MADDIKEFEGEYLPAPERAFVTEEEVRAIIDSTLSNFNGVFRLGSGKIESGNYHRRQPAGWQLTATGDNLTADLPSDANLVAYWSFDEGLVTSAGKVYDSSNNANDLTLTGGQTNADFVAGISGTALNSDGTNDYASKSSPSFVDNTQGSVSFWVKFDALTTQFTLWSVTKAGVDDDWVSLNFRGDTNKQLRIELRVNGAYTMVLDTPNNAITDTNWHYIVLKSDGSTIRLYLDNIEQTLTAVIGTNTGQWFDDATDADTFVLGALNYSSVIQFTDGKFDEFRIYSTALTAKNVHALYKYPAGGTSYFIPQNRIESSLVNVALRGWTLTNVFSVTDADTVAWGAGTFTASDGTAYSIGAGNTGNMAARTYIYLDILVSTTAFQTTTTAADAVGNGKVLVATAKNGTGEAEFEVFNGIGGMNINGSQIVASSITANEIAANTITAGNMNVTTLSAITADLGTVTAGTITGVTITGGTIQTASGTGQRIVLTGSDNQLNVYDSSNNNILSIFGSTAGWGYLTVRQFANKKGLYIYEDTAAGGDNLIYLRRSSLASGTATMLLLDNATSGRSFDILHIPNTIASVISQASDTKVGLLVQTDGQTFGVPSKDSGLVEVQTDISGRNAAVFYHLTSSGNTAAVLGILNADNAGFAIAFSGAIASATSVSGLSRVIRCKDEAGNTIYLAGYSSYA